MRRRVASVTSTDDKLFLRMRSEIAVNDSYGKSDDIRRFSGARKDASPRKTAARSLSKRTRKISGRASRACLATPSPLVSALRREGDHARPCHSDRKPFSMGLAPGECRGVVAKTSSFASHKRDLSDFKLYQLTNSWRRTQSREIS